MEKGEKGMVKFFSPTKGFGFISLVVEDESEDVFVGARAVKCSDSHFVKGAQVVLETRSNKRGLEAVWARCASCQKAVDNSARREKELADFAKWGLREVVGERRPGESLSLNGEFLSFIRYDRYPRIWAQGWGRNAPADFKDWGSPRQGALVLVHMRTEVAVGGAIDLLGELSLRSKFGTDIDNALLEADRLEQEIKDRLSPCKMVWRSAGNPFSHSRDSVDEWQEREDGLHPLSAAKIGELKSIKQARDRHGRFMKLVDAFKATVYLTPRFEIEAIQKFRIEAALKDESGRLNKIAEAEGSAPLGQVAEAIIAAAEEILPKCGEEILKRI